jgi:hypothetical protein
MPIHVCVELLTVEKGPITTVANGSTAQNIDANE